MAALIALVTGGNKGIGYEIAKQLAQAGAKVWLGARDASRGKTAANTLSNEGLDILVNNAGIAESGDGLPGIASVEAVRRDIETNFIGPLGVTAAMLPMLRKASAGRIVNISSSLGSLTLNNDPQWPFYDVKLIGYNASKAALNMLTIHLNAELKDTAITAVSACPGLVNTDLSGHKGDRSPSQAATFLVDLALQTASSSEAVFRDEAGAVSF